ncbi:methionyl-tRNA formyltransferase [Martiniozyma asiatica (nom. inval.)]|nr:methionyl-tRNA formyltransferase [Martiniozyma asiatica]
MSKLLKVAYFGSDNFSINCLKHILPLRTNHIGHFDIITRSPKLAGRGMTNLKDVPIASFAAGLGLPVIRADKKIDFEPLCQTSYDLCIAVSYGRLIPSSFLSTLKYGGLNVHPSILPRYSGPAPLQRALLNNDKTTGVTVQTLHPTEFDKGDILLNEEYTIKPDENLESLSEELSNKGGILLKEIIEQGLYDKNSPKYNTLQPQLEFSYASKINKSEAKIDWTTFTAGDIIRRAGVLESLYTFKQWTPKKKNKKSNGLQLKRVVMSGIKEYKLKETDNECEKVAEFNLNKEGDVYVKTIDGYFTAEMFKTEGYIAEEPSKFFNGLNKKFGSKDACFVDDTL